MAEPPKRGPGWRPWRASWLWAALLLAIGCGDGSPGTPSAAREAPSAPRAAPATTDAGRAGDPAGPVYYRYVEPGGSLRFVARLEDVPEAERANAKAIRGSRTSGPAQPAWGSGGKPTRRPWSEAAIDPSAAKPRADAASGRAVVVYTTSWCPWCRKTLAFLDAKHVDYVNKDIEKNSAWRDELVEKTGSASVPVVEIDGQRIDGFDQSAMERLL